MRLSTATQLVRTKSVQDWKDVRMLCRGLAEMAFGDPFWLKTGLGRSKGLGNMRMLRINKCDSLGCFTQWYLRIGMLIRIELFVQCCFGGEDPLVT